MIDKNRRPIPFETLNPFTQGDDPGLRCVGCGKNPDAVTIEVHGRRKEIAGILSVGLCRQCGSDPVTGLHVTDRERVERLLQRGCGDPFSREVAEAWIRCEKWRERRARCVEGIAGGQGDDAEAVRATGVGGGIVFLIAIAGGLVAWLIAVVVGAMR